VTRDGGTLLVGGTDVTVCAPLSHDCSHQTTDAGKGELKIVGTRTSPETEPV
jgi:hypothetical protein